MNVHQQYAWRVVIISAFLEFCFTAKNEVVILSPHFIYAGSAIMRYHDDSDYSSQSQYYPEYNLVLDCCEFNVPILFNFAFYYDCNRLRRMRFLLRRICYNFIVAQSICNCSYILKSWIDLNLRQLVLIENM